MKEAGFTLVEILAAVTITGIILVSLFALLQQSFQLWTAVGVYNHWEQNFRFLEAELTRDIHNLFASSITAKNLFKANAGQIKFYRLSSAGKMKQITYSFDRYQGQLIKETLDLESQQRERIEFFAEGTVEDVYFEFYDPETEYFKSNWSQAFYLPQAVRIKIELTTVDLPPLLIENFIGRGYGG